VQADKTLGATVETQDGKACGKVRNVTGKRGLGLLRVQEVLTTKGPLRVKSGKDVICDAETFIPRWWQTDSDEILKLTMAKKPESG